jgi:pyruvate/2-oxoglutarate dehydrogenase complex dihydrolipoamide dehydrogenase (E3) component
VRDIGLEAAGVEYDPRRGVIADRHMRTNVAISTPSATRPASTSSHTRRSARARSRPRTRSGTRRRWTTPPCRAASTPIPRSAAVGLTEAQARGARRRRRHRQVPDGRVGSRADVRRADRVCEDHSRDRYGELLGLVIVGVRPPSSSMRA